jgi:ferrous iron transport protein B
MHHHAPLVEIETASSIALIGHPNVGKSVIFQQLTGHYVTVANYPGTTVELTKGSATHFPDTAVIDTPGVITLPSRTEDEQVTAQVLFDEPLRAIIQVGDAKNLRRTLQLTLQLTEMGIPLVLALNMLDEANHRGVSVDHKLLQEHIQIPIVPTIATRGKGISQLIEEIHNAAKPAFFIQYPQHVEDAIRYVESNLPDSPISKRSIALLWLGADLVAENWMRDQLAPDTYQDLLAHRKSLRESTEGSPGTLIRQTRMEVIDRLVNLVLRQTDLGIQGAGEWLGHLAIQPIWGMVILAVVLYLLYLFVGVFGAGTLVDLLETNLFGEFINPRVTEFIHRLIPIPIAEEFFVGEYGLWTMGMTYALALILPIVSTFFLAFGILEDSGYIPRLAVLTNRVFRIMGLNGKAILPMVLGLGCVTMATLTTRIMENKRDRLLVILLLALAIPCSAQLGIVMGMLASVSLSATMIWLVVIGLVMLFVGWLAARVLPGERSPLILELPPLRRPILGNVLTKTLARLEWYLKEVVPLFLLGTAIMFGMEKTGLLDLLIGVGEPVVSGWLGLPAEASAVFLLGFLRRDFGATGLFLMASQGLLSPIQVVVSMVTITLFIPCVASVFMIGKSRGWRTSLAITAVVFPLAFIVGGLIKQILMTIGWGI